MLVHFVWWGEFNQGACESVARYSAALPHDGNHELLFWCAPASKAQFKAQLPARTSVIALDVRKFAAGVESIETHFDWMQELMTELDAFRAYSGLKDLAVLAILWRLGGLYLDTTCQLLEPEQFRRALDGFEHDERFCVPKLNDEATWTHQPGLITFHSAAFGIDRSEPSPDGRPHGSIWITPIDVWAMRGFQFDPDIARMIDSYLQRAKTIALAHRAKAPRTSQQHDLHRVLANATNSRASERDQKQGKGLRRELVGTLIVRSVYDGVSVDKTEEEVRQASEAWWKTVPNPESTNVDRTQLLVPALGVLKTYRNSHHVL